MTKFYDVVFPYRRCCDGLSVYIRHIHRVQVANEILVASYLDAAMLATDGLRYGSHLSPPRFVHVRGNQQLRVYSPLTVSADNDFPCFHKPVLFQMSRTSLTALPLLVKLRLLTSSDVISISK